MAFWEDWKKGECCSGNTEPTLLLNHIAKSILLVCVGDSQI
jgi:hypothetical protein